MKILLLLLVSSLTAAAQRDCEKVKLIEFPAGDLPKVWDTAAAPNGVRVERKSDAYKYYYGIGVSVDYVRARQLAFYEMASDPDRDDPTWGASVLLMLYANGLGVRRDIDLCIRLACGNVGHAPAELEGRTEHLKAMRTDTSAARFDICDDMTSGYSAGFCASIQSQLTGVLWKARIDSALKGWPEKDRAAYASLRKAASAFFAQRVYAEVDVSGTARGAMEIDESESLEEGFLQEILEASSCAAGGASAAGFGEADGRLNAVYSKVMQKKKTYWGTVTKRDIRDTQRQWIGYRDAWAVFGAVRCPAVRAEAWKTMITEERILQLKDFLGD